MLVLEGEDEAEVKLSTVTWSKEISRRIWRHALSRYGQCFHHVLMTGGEVRAGKRQFEVDSHELGSKIRDLRQVC